MALWNTPKANEPRTLSVCSRDSAEATDEFDGDELLSFSAELDTVLSAAEVQHQKLTPPKKLSIFRRPLSPNRRQTLVTTNYVANRLSRADSAERESLCAKGTRQSEERSVKLRHYGYEQISNCRKLIKHTNKIEREYNSAIVAYNRAKARLTCYGTTLRTLRSKEFRARTQRDRWID